MIQSDCVEAMAKMDECSVDAVVCDPPYGLEFMGKEWDRLGAGVEGFAASDYGSADGSSFGQPGGQHVRYGKSAKTMQGWHQAWATEALRILKPGGHLLAFGGTRTYHRLACAVEDAGFEIRDSLIWLYGSGFPKSLDVSKAIDKAAGAEREVVGVHPDAAKRTSGTTTQSGWETPSRDNDLTAPATPEAQQWQGWGTALKPAHEPIVVARKPLSGTVAANVLEHGTGALNVDGCRIGFDGEEPYTYPDGPKGNTGRGAAFNGEGMGRREGEPVEGDPAGRWPANVALSHLPECERVGTRRVKKPGGNGEASRSGKVEGDWQGYEGNRSPITHYGEDGTETIPAYSCAPGCPIAELDRQSGEAGSVVKHVQRSDHRAASGATVGWNGEKDAPSSYGDTGGASRFFYCAKASRGERNAGLDGFEERNDTAHRRTNLETADRPHLRGLTKRQNVHPTVKPIDLMRWLVRLVTPPGGTVLDPFTGSGTTGCAAVLEGFDFIGIEREAEYAEIARARIEFWAQFPGQEVEDVLGHEGRQRAIRDTGQLGLLEAS